MCVSALSWVRNSMELSAKTKIDDLLTHYPFLLDFLTTKSPKYKLLRNPVSRKTIGKVATLSQVASIGGLVLDELLTDIAAEISEHDGNEVSVKRTEGEAGTLPLRDRQARQEILKEIIRDLHDGEDMEIIKQRFHDLIKDIGPTEIAAMEQALIEEGMPESEVKRLCDVHVGVFKESLEVQPAPEAAAGHPVNTFMLENRATEEVVQRIAEVIDKAADLEDQEFALRYQGRLEELMDQLAEIDLHYLRKENQLFPILEEHNIQGPSQVMWALHDDIRAAIKTAKAELADGQFPQATITIRYAIQSIIDMIYKEEHILFPMALETVSEPEWRRVRDGEEEIGYAWIAPPVDWRGLTAPAAADASEPVLPEALSLTTGHLTPEQVDLMLLHLPVELSFVDENDEVCYYSQVEHKIFPRSPGVIGRKVQNCHPRASLDKVQRILDDFRSGKQSDAHFWIETRDRFIYISYFAVRDADGTYKGTIETVQDITGIRGLTGQKRLLDWE